MIEHALLILSAWPLGGAVLALAWPGGRDRDMRLVAVLWAAVGALGALGWIGMEAGGQAGDLIVGDGRFGGNEWEGWLGRGWRLQDDIWSMGGVVFTALALPLYMLSGWGHQGAKGQVLCLSGLGCALAGCFTSEALWGWIFWQQTALVFLVSFAGCWGREEALRLPATLRLAGWGALSGGIMVGCVLYLGETGGIRRIGWGDLGGIELDLVNQQWILAALLVALSAHVPFFPLHTWLAPICARSPEAGAVVVGLWGPLGLYGFLRLVPVLCADALVLWRPYLIVGAAAGLLYCGLLSLVQRDLLRRQVYVIHTFYAMVFLATIGLGNFELGSALLIMQVTAAASALFLASGAMARGRLPLQRIDLRAQPVLASCWLAASLFLSGVPILGLFVPLFSLLVGTAGSLGIAVLLSGGWAMASYSLLSLVDTKPTPLGPANSRPALWQWGPSLCFTALALWLALYPEPLYERVALVPDGSVPTLMPAEVED
jgi:NADH-quinone oxidoreductase subunit M